MGLIAKLNKLSDKSPDDIARLLTNPWMRMGRGFVSEEFFNQNREREVILYNYRDGQYLDSVSFARASRRQMGYWRYSTWDSTANRHYYFAFADEAVPFDHEVHLHESHRNPEPPRPRYA